MYCLQFVNPFYCNVFRKSSVTLFGGPLSRRKVSGFVWYFHKCFVSTPAKFQLEKNVEEPVYTLGKYFMKFRNPGGFKLPPVVPSKKQDLQRAVSLLGHRTQGYLTAPRVIELIQLVGAYPLDKETAQRWKGALELYQRKEVNLAPKFQKTTSNRPSRHFVYREGEVVGSVLYNKFMDVISVPRKDEDVSRVFRILGLFCGRGFFLEEEKKQIQQLIGYIPRDSREAKRVSNALKRLVHARVMYERHPPVTPEDCQVVLKICQLLCKVERFGTAGEQGDAYIQEVLKGFPRNENVAKWWYKRLLAVYRAHERKAEAETRKNYLEQVRNEKKERKKLLSILNKSYQVDSHIKEAGDTFFC
ncbi:hypothetical protein Gasu2_54690 [Galdieria sulphuraria]|uniref:Uncharacterized protein n=1 Tax=Galdieria sulphuraria TaxID=130081 RepID=M2VVM2_GALSU|nr:uncharacterized protein Gasu_51290 [Galdieria sulphuraria]EME27271.1 hypothetical protein Gasu_51290 [Galdieria sulphuraria]GJD11329.1 hypothetical protein Gasu2_54690 [Galdieria sulphuraria]|eukprot:XP_005703791.1 hypothetical protein Gasu_51290 [Galdieria sulphuraria]